MQQLPCLDYFLQGVKLKLNFSKYCRLLRLSVKLSSFCHSKVWIYLLSFFKFSLIKEGYKKA